MNHHDGVRRAGEPPGEGNVPSIGSWLALSLEPLKRLAAPLVLILIWYTVCAGGLLPKLWFATGSVPSVSTEARGPAAKPACDLASR